jgi:hypothetical protein
MNDPGGFNPISNINLTIDQASASISDPTDMTSDPLVPGTYKPTNLSPAGIVAGPPRPDGPYSTSLSVFNGTSLNGTWGLFVRDFSASDAGQLASGLGVQGIAPQHGSLLLLGIGLLVVAGWLRRRAR